MEINTNMNISENGINLIKKFEGFSPKTYADIVGDKTIGFGHKLVNNQKFPNGISELQANQILLKDLIPTENYLNQKFSSLNQNQFDSLCDFSFNLGLGSLEQLLSHGIDRVPTQILQWDHANHVEVEQLKERREVELALFQKKE
ncbi:Uncharacterised protein [uncultured archaeon]|nr:Uncharacterised protein [uncultured archaeon]